MDPFKFFRKAEVETKEKSHNNALGEVLADFYGVSSISGEKLDKNWVHVAVAKISEAAAGVDWKTMRMVGDEPEEVDDDNLVARTLANPNPYSTWRQFIFKVAGLREFTGEAVIWIRTQGGKTELWCMNPHEVRPEWNETKTEIKYWKYNSAKRAETVQIPTNQIAWLRVPDLFSNEYGTGTVDKIGDWIEVEQNATKLVKTLATSGTFVGGVLETEAVDQSQLENIARLFDRKYKGVKNAMKTLILPQGAKYTPGTTNARDMEFDAMERRYEEKILKAFSIPGVMLGQVDGDGRANVEGAMTAFGMFKLVPALDDIREVINEQIIPKLTDEPIFIDYENPIPEDKQFALEEKKAALGNKAWRAVNEVREDEGLDPMSGHDELPEQPDPSEQKPPQPVKYMPARVKAFVAREKKEAPKRNPVPDNTVQKAILELVHKQFEARVFEKQDNVEKIIENHAKGLNITVSGKKAEAREEYIDVQKELEALQNEVRPEQRRTAEIEGKSAFSLVVDPVGNFNSRDKGLLKELDRVFELRGLSYLTTLNGRIADAVKAGIQEGEDAKQLQARIDKVIGTVAQYKAKQVAQDVVFTTANSAIKSAYQQSGVVQTMKWFTAEDERVCPHCNAVDGMTVKVTENFFEKGGTLSTGSGNLDFGFDAIPHPPLHSNCRCFLLPDKLNIN